MIPTSEFRYRSKESVDENDNHHRLDHMEYTYGLVYRNLRRSREGLKQGPAGRTVRGGHTDRATVRD